MSKNYLKTVNRKETYIIDKSTGEILEVKKRNDKILVKNKEEFFMTYSQILGLYKDLTGVQIKILTWLILNQSTYNSNMVTLTRTIKKEISKNMSISVSAVNNSIPVLVKKNVLIRQGGSRSATYLINPEYFWKGDLGERNKKLKFILEVELDITSNTKFEV